MSKKLTEHIKKHLVHGYKHTEHNQKNSVRDEKLTMIKKQWNIICQKEYHADC